MQHRETAVRMSQTAFMVARELSELGGHIYQDHQKKNISEEDSQKYMEIIQFIIDSISRDLIDPIFKIHPDLRPVCSGCQTEPHQGKHK